MSNRPWVGVEEDNLLLDGLVGDNGKEVIEVHAIPNRYGE